MDLLLTPGEHVLRRYRDYLIREFDAVTTAERKGVD